MKQSGLKQLLGQAFDAFRDVDDDVEHAKKKAEFVFHMTDWTADLEKLAELYSDPRSMDQKAARQCIFGFIVHVAPHLNAAGRLMVGETTDPFAPAEVGHAKNS